MATTVSAHSSHVEGGLTFVHLTITVGAADTSATYTVTGAPQLLGMSQPFKTTGTTGDITAVYNMATGVITFATLANNDVFRVTVWY